MSDEVTGAIPIETREPSPDPTSADFDPSMLILGQRPFATMTDAELIAGIRQLREIREPLLQGATRRALRLPTKPRENAPKDAKPTRKPKRLKGIDATAADFISSLFDEKD